MNNRLIIEASEIGQSINCELCVSAIDYKGRELFVCTKIAKKGEDVKCRKCSEKPQLIDFIYKPIDLALLTWRPLVMEKFSSQQKENFKELK